MVFEPYGRLLNNVYTKWPVFLLRCNVFAISNNSFIMKQPVRKRQGLPELREGAERA